MGYDPEPQAFQALLGGDDWAVELTHAEFQDFCRLAQQLSQTLEQMRLELMDEEAIACEASSEFVHVEARGYPEAFDLSFILLIGRRSEGYWPAIATPEVLRAIQMLQVF